jgi:Uma2 family endonuclease
MTARWPGPGESLTLRGVDWDLYRGLSRLADRRGGLKRAYDRGTLDILVPSFEHERRDRVLHRLIVTLTEEMGLPIVEGGIMTLRRKPKRIGIEADEICWIQNAQKLSGMSPSQRRTLPPDLAIEVDVSRSSNDKLELYRKFQIPEIWRLTEDHLSLHILGPDGYKLSMNSSLFPMIQSMELLPFLRDGIHGGNTNAMIMAFRRWFRIHKLGQAESSSE